jgi:Beta/Gamma crystallin
MPYRLPMSVLVIIIVLGLVGRLAAQPPRASRSAGEMPQIIAFDGSDFTGDHTHIFGDMPKLGKWDNSISSLVILSGTWEFFEDDNFTGGKKTQLGPGLYPRVTDQGLKGNSISSIRLVSPRAAEPPPGATERRRTR